MRVRILEAGRYLDPDRLPLRKARRFKVGDEVEWPADYARAVMHDNAAVALTVEERKVIVVEEDKDEFGDGINATPGARTLAEEMHIDLRTVQGTGKHGRILMKDVEPLG